MLPIIVCSCHKAETVSKSGELSFVIVLLLHATKMPLAFVIKASDMVMYYFQMSLACRWVKSIPLEEVNFSLSGSSLVPIKMSLFSAIRYFTIPCSTHLCSCDPQDVNRNEVFKIGYVPVL